MINRHYYYIDRPGTIVAAISIMWVQFGIGAIAFCSAFALLDTSAMPTGQGAGPIITFFVILFMGVMFLQALLAVKIFQGFNWARITEIVLCSIALGFGVISLCAADTESLLFEIIGIGINITLIMLLTREDAVTWCKQFSQ